uniref:Uncharacterized protein n=1 Tax=Cuerna arida TaxID=1464854 RepID=A0A1B6F9T0_9HEMI
MKAVLALLGALLTCQAVSAQFYANGYNGLFAGGYPFYPGTPGFGVGVVEEVVEPIIPVSSGLVDARSYVDSYFPGSSYCGFGTYGPAYGGLGYPLDVYGPSVFPGPVSPLFPNIGFAPGFAAFGVV